MVEVIPSRYVTWAHDSGRLDPNAARSPRVLVVPEPLRVVFPGAGQRFVIDRHVSLAQQELVLRAEAPAGARLQFSVDGVAICESTLPFQCPWRVSHGRHELVVRSEAGASAPITFGVE